MSENPTEKHYAVSGGTTTTGWRAPSDYRFDYYDWRYLVTVIIAILSIQVFTVAMVIVIWEVLK